MPAPLLSADLAAPIRRSSHAAARPADVERLGRAPVGGLVPSTPYNCQTLRSRGLLKLEADPLIQSFGPISALQKCRFSHRDCGACGGHAETSFEVEGFVFISRLSSNGKEEFQALARTQQRRCAGWGGSQGYI